MYIDPPHRKKIQEFRAKELAVGEGDKNVRLQLGYLLSFGRTEFFELEERDSPFGHLGYGLSDRRWKDFLSPSLGRRRIAENASKLMPFSDGFEARDRYGRTSGE